MSVDNLEEMKQRTQYLNMRGAQMAMESSHKDNKTTHHQKRGSMEQLLGTIAGIVTIIVIITVLAFFKII